MLLPLGREVTVIMLEFEDLRRSSQPFYQALEYLNNLVNLGLIIKIKATKSKTNRRSRTFVIEPHGPQHLWAVNDNKSISAVSTSIGTQPTAGAASV